jgi:hypothetical protein
MPFTAGGSDLSYVALGHLAGKCGERELGYIFHITSLNLALEYRYT